MKAKGKSKGLIMALCITLIVTMMPVISYGKSAPQGAVALLRGTDTYYYSLKLKETLTTTNNYCTVSYLAQGTTYKFSVGALKTYDGITYTGTLCTKKTSITRPGKVSKPKLYTGKTHYVKAAWGKETCSGYRIELATNKSFSKGKKTYYTTSRSKTFKSLKKSKRYYVRVTAYKKLGTTKYYGAKSSVTSIKCK